MKKPTLLGESPAVRSMLHLISKVAASNTNVLITGESGTGKELVARLIHDSGPLAQGGFVAVNCGAIPENLIESEMFGHQKGSFTGAFAEKKGLFETANGGTLFLDEIGELPLSMQVKLLRAIQERKIKRVGAAEEIRIDVRLIAATNRDLEACVAKGTFREDLLRLNDGFTPPLRERHATSCYCPQILRSFAAKNKKTSCALTSPWKTHRKYPWPGNVQNCKTRSSGPSRWKMAKA